MLQAHPVSITASVELIQLIFLQFIHILIKYYRNSMHLKQLVFSVIHDSLYIDLVKFEVIRLEVKFQKNWQNFK